MRERYISVDVETSGPIPGEFSLLAIGACVVDDETSTFHLQLKPISRNVQPEAMKVHGLSLDSLIREGIEPGAAMTRFLRWTEAVSGKGATPVFVGLNAPFDWSFVNYYFHRFVGANPFGFSALDIKALYMGATGCTWRETGAHRIARRLRPTRTGTHDALEDAQYQAELFRLIRSLSLPRVPDLAPPPAC